MNSALLHSNTFTELGVKIPIFSDSVSYFNVEPVFNYLQKPAFSPYLLTFLPFLAEINNTDYGAPKLFNTISTVFSSCAEELRDQFKETLLIHSKHIILPSATLELK